MSKYIEEFKRLNDLFLARKITADVYENKFKSLMLDPALNPGNEYEQKLVNELKEWITLFEPKVWVGKGGSTANAQRLRLKIKETQQKVNQLVPRKFVSGSL